MIEEKWPGHINRIQAIRLLDGMTDVEDAGWEYATEDYYDEDTDTLPSIYHVFKALGVTKEEYEEASGAKARNWPT